MSLVKVSGGWAREMKPMRLPCGGLAYFDTSSGISYRCECGAVVGSIGMPQTCKEEMTKWENWAKLGGNDWDYFPDDKECPTS